MDEEKTIYDCDVETGLSNMEEKVQHFRSVAEKVAKAYTETLDIIMREIKEQIIDIEEPATKTIERYFLELTNALYFIGANAETTEIYATVSKLNQKNTYSNSYLNSALPGYSDKTLKRTAAELDCIATVESLEEIAMMAITKSVQNIVSYKIEAAKDMTKTLSKVLTTRNNELPTLGTKQTLNEVF